MKITSVPSCVGKTVKDKYLDRQIAYKIWIELITRKIALKLDLDNDVIHEVYNSWYETFKVIRELIKEIPVNKVAKNKNTRQLVELAIDILNKPLRQHLTTWQAKYRRWYEDEIKKHLDKSPQDIQKTFPEYDELTKDLLKVNKELIKYADSIKRIALQK